MRALAALLLLAHAAALRYSATYSAARDPANDTPQRTVEDILEGFIARTLAEIGVDGNATWPTRAAQCARALGVAGCVKAFAVCRAERIAEANGSEIQFEEGRELEGQFPWERFMNISQEQMDERLASGTASLLARRSLSLSFPGLLLEVDSKSNGTLNVDFLRDPQSAAESGRGWEKKFQKNFYRIVPFLLVPPLIMSAILPFVLPALKMMTMGVAMLNQMALTGAIFTLLRNNALDDKYEKRVVYVNDGYKNEQHEGQFYSEDNHYYEDENPVKRRGHKKKNKRRRPSKYTEELEADDRLSPNDHTELPTHWYGEDFANAGDQVSSPDSWRRRDHVNRFKPKL